MNEEYSNRARGERNADTSSDSTSTLHLDETPPERKSTANGARLIQKVYEVDPLARYLVNSTCSTGKSSTAPFIQVNPVALRPLGRKSLARILGNR